jgi:alanine-glyoxylate transaminase/serine-glyoxylate transaminase/serine-pyruvate transaminase
MDSATLPRCFLDFRDMLNTNPKGGFPYTPPVNLFYGLGESLKMLLDEEGLENVFARHHRIAEGIRRGVAGWGLTLCAQSPDLYSDTVSAIVVPEGFDGTRFVVHAADKYGDAFGVGLGDVAGKVFRIGHLGSLTDVMALSGLACAEMTMADLGFPISLGSGVAAAADYYRTTEAAALSKVA